MTSGYHQDFTAMKRLLTSWHVEVLYEFFKEEDISIEELKMMQFSHINILLRNYKMGVRIRFEHHLKNWRNMIGIPLQTGELIQADVCFCRVKPAVVNGYNEHINNNANVSPIVYSTMRKRRRNENQELAPDEVDAEEYQQPLSPQSPKSDCSLMKTSNFNEVPMTVLRSPMNQSANAEEDTETENLTLNTLTDFLATSLDDTPPKFPSKPTSEKCPVDLKQILQLSGSRGMAIVKFYNEKNRLTNIHRAQLIQTIVEFFDDNDYHLSLNMSHKLEWEILKMFPTEKLEYYRTEKRGKIYVKFSNMKRYKRERSNKAKSETETVGSRPRKLQQNQANQSTDVIIEDQADIDEWPAAAETQIQVKEENMCDNI